jgi:hypothetical protein
MVSRLHLIDDFVLALRQGLQPAHDHPRFGHPILFGFPLFAFLFGFFPLHPSVALIQ